MRQMAQECSLSVSNRDASCLLRLSDLIVTACVEGGGQCARALTLCETVIPGCSAQRANIVSATRHSACSPPLAVGGRRRLSGSAH